MLVQIMIISVILVAGGLLFSSEIHGLFPKTIETATTSLKHDVTELSTQTVNSIERGIDESTKVIGKNIDSPVNMLESSKDSISKKITEIKTLDTSNIP